MNWCGARNPDASGNNAGGGSLCHKSAYSPSTHNNTVGGTALPAAANIRRLHLRPRSDRGARLFPTFRPSVQTCGDSCFSKTLYKGGKTHRALSATSRTAPASRPAATHQQLPQFAPTHHVVILGPARGGIPARATRIDPPLRSARTAATIVKRSRSIRT